MQIAKLRSFLCARESAYHNLSPVVCACACLHPKVGMVTMVTRRSSRRSNFQICEDIGEKFTIKVTTSTGIVARNDALRILKQSLTGSSMSHNIYDIGNSYFAIIYNRREKPLCAAVLHIDRHTKLATISLFATDPKWQGQGLGTMLNAFLVEQCLRRNLKLCVQASPFAIGFWKKLGYRHLKSEELCYFGIKATCQTKVGRTKLGGETKEEREFDTLLYDGKGKKIKNILCDAKRKYESPRRSKRQKLGSTNKDKENRMTRLRPRKKRKRRK